MTDEDFNKRMEEVTRRENSEYPPRSPQRTTIEDEAALRAAADDKFLEQLEEEMTKVCVMIRRHYRGWPKDVSPGEVTRILESNGHPYLKVIGGGGKTIAAIGVPNLIYVNEEYYHQLLEK